VKVPCDEGVANRIDPESCAGSREAACEALTGAHVGQPLSGVRLHNRSADALQSAEGNTARCVKRASRRLRVVVRPWHACTSSIGKQEISASAQACRGMGRVVKAGGRRP